MPVAWASTSWGPEAAEGGAVWRQFSDQFGELWVFGMASGVEVEGGHEVPGGEVPFGVELAVPQLPPTAFRAWPISG